MQLSISGKVIKIARLEDEWYKDIEYPQLFVCNLNRRNQRIDLFTFFQRLPDSEPKYNFHTEWESIAALSLKTYNFWWENQINSKTRNLVRKAEKKGVVIKLVPFDDQFIRGMHAIFNETPIRQEKPFWHYGKDMDTLRKEFSRNLEREVIIAAYYQSEMIGFIMLADAGQYAMTTQIISKIAHRDKSPTNALLAKAVEICCERHTPYLVYAKWTTGTLGDFKRHNGFVKVDLPRYYIPLTAKGRLCLNLNLHHGLSGIVPERYRSTLLQLRRELYARKYATGV